MNCVDFGSLFNSDYKAQEEDNIIRPSDPADTTTAPSLAYSGLLANEAFKQAGNDLDNIECDMCVGSNPEVAVSRTTEEVIVTSKNTDEEKAATMDENLNSLALQDDTAASSGDAAVAAATQDIQEQSKSTTPELV
eukprot:CAMPEP_0194034108 /NCGR_PEP_ID=MMETSP0009_2-20130614/6513_1 /TAXON_ID=210454 /ORGANISM="Grammatophora oceanica, Strain CCMP 410" /LENGTH=135 /DNA_ID=CAMNT_0038674869 /DNA_START=194 /DNA_END=601 /DNA_ORIENTATION=+